MRGAYVGNDTRHLVGGILIHAAHMLPELLRAVLAIYRLARLPLLLRDAIEVAIATLIEAMIWDEEGLDDRAVLPNRDHGELFDVEINSNRHQVGVEYAF